MKLNEFDVIRRYVGEGCVRHDVGTRVFYAEGNIVYFLIEKEMTGEPQPEKSVLVADYVAQEMGLRGWRVDTWTDGKGLLSVAFKKEDSDE